jgi:hypothetical protein
MTTKQKLSSYNNQKAKYFLLLKTVAACIYATFPGFAPEILSVKAQQKTKEEL